jgi:MoxR-like ATPase
MTNNNNTTLRHLVPNKSYFDSYIPREMPGTDSNDVEVLETLIKQKFNPLLQGPTGPGKTSAIYAVCAKNEIPLVSLNCNGMITVEDLVGQIVATDDAGGDTHELIERVAQARLQTILAREKKNPEAFLAAQLEQSRAELELDNAYHSASSGLAWRDGVLVQMMRGDGEHEHTMILADEVNFAPAKVMAALNAATDHRREITLTQHLGEVITAHGGFAFAAAMNPHYEGTRPLNKAFKDRFVVLNYDYDEKIEAQLIKNENLLGLAKKLRRMFDQDEIQTPISPRALMRFEEIERLFGTDFAVETFCSMFDEDERPSVLAATTLHLRGGSAAAGDALGAAADPDMDSDQ